MAELGPIKSESLPPRSMTGDIILGLISLDLPTEKVISYSGCSILVLLQSAFEYVEPRLFLTMPLALYMLLYHV